MRKPSNHPIAAITAAHDEFRRTATWLGPCFDSDLRHDTKMVNAHPEPFAWLISPHGTHAYRLGSLEECYVATQRSWGGGSAARYLTSCIECYDGAASVASGWLRLYVWDGASLVRYMSVDSFMEGTRSVIRNRAIAHAESHRAPHAERAAYLGTHHDFDDEITAISEWS